MYKNRTQNIYKLSYNQDKYTRFNNLENYTLINTYVVLTASNILKSLGMKDLYDVSVKERLFSNKKFTKSFNLFILLCKRSQVILSNFK